MIQRGVFLGGDVKQTQLETWLAVSLKGSGLNAVRTRSVQE